MGHTCCMVFVKQRYRNAMRFWVVAAVSIQTMIFSRVTPCSLVEDCGRFGRSCYLFFKHRKWIQQFLSKRPYSAAELHGIIFQKIAFY